MRAGQELSDLTATASHNSLTHDSSPQAVPSPEVAEPQALGQSNDSKLGQGEGELSSHEAPDQQSSVVNCKSKIHSRDPLQYYDQPITQIPEIPRSSDPWFYHPPEHLFVPSIPSDSCEPLRLFLIRCREADLAAVAELKAKAADSR